MTDGQSERIMSLITGRTYHLNRKLMLAVSKYICAGQPLLNVGTQLKFQRVRIEVGLLLEIGLVVLAHVMVDQGDRH